MFSKPFVGRKTVPRATIEAVKLYADRTEVDVTYFSNGEIVYSSSEYYMKNILTIFALLLLFAGCSNSRDTFVGTWANSYMTFTPEGYVDAQYIYELRLDFAHPGSVKCDQLNQPADGVLYAYEDMAVCSGEVYEPITLVEVEGDTAFVEYIHNETGERWSAKLAFNPADNRVETIDCTMGITPGNPIVGVENITDDMIPKIYTGCDEVTVYESKGEAPARTTVYDLDGNKIK
ncbi:MAG: hypothetical protein ACI3X6_08260 [Alloprevotella sp.]